MDPKNSYDGGGSNVLVDGNHDILSEILIRVDPSSILKYCKLVSKEWLSLITSHVFRKNYLNRWKNSSFGVVGLLMYDPRGIEERRCPRAQFLPTSKLGKQIIYWNSALGDGHYGFFMSKSSKGGLLLFGNADFDSWYVCNPILRGPPVKLPPPPVVYERCLAYIRCDDEDGDDYMVILARQSSKPSYITVNIQTFCSRTGKWEQFTPSCLLQLSVLEDAVVDRGGDVIHWRGRKSEQACLVAWEVNQGRVSVTPEPPFIVGNKDAICYGLCPKGSLVAATYAMCEDYPAINIWALSDDKRDWHLLYNVRQESVRNNKLPALTTLFEELSEGEFVFVSFMRRSSMSGWDKQVFIYDFKTRNLKYACSKDFLKCDSDEFLNFHPSVKYHPLTVLDLGIWPSLASSMQ